MRFPSPNPLPAFLRGNCFFLLWRKTIFFSSLASEMLHLFLSLVYLPCVLCLVAKLCLILCNSMDCSPPGSSVYGDSPGKNTGLGCHDPPPADLPNPGIKTRSPTLWADSLPSEPPGKPKNTGVGSLSLLQVIFPTQELNWGLLHCRWILYQLSYQGSPG